MTQWDQRLQNLNKCIPKKPKVQVHTLNFEEQEEYRNTGLTKKERNDLKKKKEERAKLQKKQRELEGTKKIQISQV